MLDRSARTLSGGEAQRIRLATQIGSQLTGVLYILDEPSIGLHQRDDQRLIGSLRNLRDGGNSVIVVEHDKEMMMSADHLIDIGPGAGEHGGRIVAQGHPQRPGRKAIAVTARYLRNELRIEVPKERRKGNGERITLRGASGNNLKDVDVDFPLGKFICVTGVSGSGKSTLIGDTLYPILSKHFYRSETHPLPYEKIEGLAAHRQGDRGGPKPDRPHPAQQSGHLYRPVRPHPRTVCPTAQRQDPRVQGRSFQLQHRRRPLRDLQGRRRARHRDELPARCERALRDLPRQTLRPRDTRRCASKGRASPTYWPCPWKRPWRSSATSRRST